MQKDADAYRTISEVAQDLSLPSHVLRFWETKFPQIKPLKRGGGRRYYRPQDADLLRGIRRLLHDDGYTIRGVQRLLKDQGPTAIIVLANGPQSAARAEETRGEASASLEFDDATAREADQPARTSADLGRESLGQADLSTLRSLLDEIERCRHALASALVE